MYLLWMAYTAAWRQEEKIDDYSMFFSSGYPLVIPSLYPVVIYYDYPVVIDSHYDYPLVIDIHYDYPVLWLSTVVIV